MRKMLQSLLVVMIALTMVLTLVPVDLVAQAASESGTTGSEGSTDGQATATEVQVTFDANGGAFAENATTYSANFYSGETNMNAFYYAKNVNAPEGKILKGWSTTKDEEGTFVTEYSFRPTENVTLYAHYADKPTSSYSVTFNANGGSVYNGTTYADSVTRDVEIGKTLQDIPAVSPLEKGMIFSSWNTAADGTGETFSYNTIPEHDMTVYAIWKSAYTLTCHYIFDGNDVTMSIQTDENGIAYEPMGGDQDITGWSLTEGGQAIDFRTYVFTEDTDLYALYEGKCKVTFDITNGHMANQDPKYGANEVFYYVKKGEDLFDQYGSLVTRLASPVPNDPNQVFIGWSTSTSSKDLIWSVDRMVVSHPSYVPTGDVTLHAIWTKAYTVTFDYNGGNPPYEGCDSVTKVIPGSQLTSYPYTSTRDGYIFCGWSTDKNATEGMNSLYGYVPTGDTTFYAVWEKGYTITYKADGVHTYFQSMDPSQTIKTEYKTVAKKGSKLLYANYQTPEVIDDDLIFDGWSLTKDGEPIDDTVIIDKDTTLYPCLKSCHTVTIAATSNTEKRTIKFGVGMKNTLGTVYSSGNKMKSIGYATEENGPVVYNTYTPYEFNENTTLYPVMRKLYTVKFYYDGIYREYYTEEGTKICDIYGQFAIPKPGEAVTGLSLTPDGDLVDFDTYKITGDVDLYVRYTKDYHRLTVNYNSEEYNADIVYDFGNVQIFDLASNMSVGYAANTYVNSSDAVLVDDVNNIEYYAIGYSLDKEGKQPITFEEANSYLLDKDLTLYVQYNGYDSDGNLISSNNQPTDPTPSDPEPTQPSDPQPSDPEPTQPSDPQPADPTPSQPTPDKPSDVTPPYMGEDIPQNVQKEALEAIATATIPKNEEVSVPKSSGVRISSISALPEDSAARATIEKMVGAVLNTVQNAKSALLKTETFELKAEGKGHINIFVGKQFANHVVIVGHYHDNEWTTQQEMVDVNGYISPYFASFSPIVLMVTDSTEAIQNLPTNAEPGTVANSVSKSVNPVEPTAQSGVAASEQNVAAAAAQAAANDGTASAETTSKDAKSATKAKSPKTGDTGLPIAPIATAVIAIACAAALFVLRKKKL